MSYGNGIGVSIMALLSIVAIVIGARAFGRAVAWHGRRRDAGAQALAASL